MGGGNPLCGTQRGRGAVGLLRQLPATLAIKSSKTPYALVYLGVQHRPTNPSIPAAFATCLALASEIIFAEDEAVQSGMPLTTGRACNHLLRFFG